MKNNQPTNVVGRKCEICNEPPLENSVICSDRCTGVRLKLLELGRKYFPTNGCDNCLGDLHQSCSAKCKQEFADSLAFGKDLWSIIRLIYPAPKKGNSR